MSTEQHEEERQDYHKLYIFMFSSLGANFFAEKKTFAATIKIGIEIEFLACAALHRLRKTQEIHVIGQLTAEST